MELLVRAYVLITHLFSSFPGIYAQDNSNIFEQGIYNNRAIDSDVLVYLLLTLAAIIFGLIYGLHAYNKWKKFKMFEDEMKSLDLNPEDESTFSGMVRRFEMDEPVNILMSARLFDEMATKEIEKVLGSAGSRSAKEKFIQTIYRIRTRTYHPDWLSEKEEIRPSAIKEPLDPTEHEVPVH